MKMANDRTHTVHIHIHQTPWLVQTSDVPWTQIASASNPASLENCSLQPHQHRLRNSNTPVTR